jgi:flagellin-specific chaperone FliS
MQIDRAMEILERAKSDYNNGDTVGAILKLEEAEDLIRKLRVRLCSEIRRDGYDAVFIK